MTQWPPLWGLVSSFPITRHNRGNWPSKSQAISRFQSAQTPGRWTFALRCTYLSSKGKVWVAFLCWTQSSARHTFTKSSRCYSAAHWLWVQWKYAFPWLPFDLAKLINTLNKQLLHFLQALLKDDFQLFVTFVVVSELVKATQLLARVLVNVLSSQIIFDFGLRVVDSLKLVFDLFQQSGTFWVSRSVRNCRTMSM